MKLRGLHDPTQGTTMRLGMHSIKKETSPRSISLKTAGSRSHAEIWIVMGSPRTAHGAATLRAATLRRTRTTQRPAANAYTPKCSKRMTPNSATGVLDMNNSGQHLMQHRRSQRRLRRLRLNDHGMCHRLPDLQVQQQTPPSTGMTSLVPMSPHSLCSAATSRRPCH